MEPGLHARTRIAPYRYWRSLRHNKAAAVALVVFG